MTLFHITILARVKRFYRYRQEHMQESSAVLQGTSPAENLDCPSSQPQGRHLSVPLLVSQLMPQKCSVRI